MKSYTKIFIILILCLFVIGVVGAKEITISKGISLSNTPENKTVDLKQVIKDFKVAPSEVVTKQTDIVSKGMRTNSVKKSEGEPVVEGGIEYSESPISVAIVGMSPYEKASYKAEYIAKYSDLVGTHKVNIDGKKVILIIKDVGYNSDNGMLVLNLSAMVNGQEKRIRNPYKIYNPPVLVKISPDVINETDHKNSTLGNYLESESDAILESISYNVINMDNGEATFGDPDPTVVIYATDSNSGYESVARISASETFLQEIVGSGNAGYISDPAYASGYAGVYTDSGSLGVNRNLLSFNTSFLSSNHILSSNINVYGSYSLDQFGLFPNLSFTKFTSPRTANYNYNDYQTNGTASTRYGNDISISSFITSGYNSMLFSSNGISQINKTGYTQIMGRISQDVDSVSVAKPETEGVSEFIYYTSNATGTAQDPYLSITYSVDAGYSIPSDFSATPRTTGTTIPVTFTPVNISTTFGFNWSFGDGSWTNTSSASSVQHIYSSNGLYSPALYRYNSTSHFIANETTKTDYIGINVIPPIQATLSGNPYRSVEEPFSSLITGVGSNLTELPGSLIFASATSNMYNYNQRSIFIFDTSIIPSGYNISSARINVTSNMKMDYLATPGYIVWTSANPTSTSSIIASDYNKNGTVDLTNRIAISAIDVEAVAPTQWTLTSSGISNINKAGKTSFMIRTSFDVDSSDQWVSEAGAGVLFMPETATSFLRPTLYLTLSNLTTPSDFSVNTPIVTNGTAITFTPVGSTLDGVTYNWSYGDGSWSNVSTNAAQTHSYSTTNLYSPTLYIMSGSTVVNSTTKTDYIGIDSAKFSPIVDGYTSRTTTGTFSTIITGAGTSVTTSGGYDYSRVSSTSTTNNYNRIDRTTQVYNTSNIPDGITITAAAINLYGYAKSSTFSTQPGIIITGVNGMASLTSLAASDYNKNLTAALSNTYPYASYATSSYNSIPLNSAGLTYLIGNIKNSTPFDIRTTWDVNSTAPTWSTSKTAYFQHVSKTGASNQQPHLIVNFTAASVYFTSNKTTGIPGVATIQFYDNSTPTQATWNWSFGDGSYSALQNPSHTYSAAGLYTVTETSPYPGITHLTRTNYINISEPSFYCSPTTAESAPANITCYDTSAIITEDNQWIWGDTTTTNDGSITSHTYTTNGTYYVQMQTPSSTGDIVTISTPLYIGANPNPTSMIKFKLGETLSVNNGTPYTATVVVRNITSTTSVKGIINWTGNYLAVNNVRINATTYATGLTLDTYSIDKNSLTFTVNKTTGINIPNPSGAAILDFDVNYISYADPGTAVPAYFNAGCQYYDPSSNLYWPFTTDTSGTALIGDWSTITGSFTANQTAIATGSTVAFTLTNTGYPDTWLWDFGDGITSSAQNPTHTYTTHENKTVSVKSYISANSSINNISSITQYIQVYNPITSVSFSATPYAYTNINNALTLTGTVVGDATGYIWDVNGGTGSSGTTNPLSYTYTTTGNKTINFTAYNPISSKSIITPNAIQVFGLGVPYVQFTGQPVTGIPGVLVSYTDDSLHGTTSGLVCNWSFGDSSYTLTPYSNICGNVAHVYTYAGVYDVSYNITNANGTSYLNKQQYITVASSQSMTWFSPLVVTITVIDQYGNFVPGAKVNAVYNSTSLPGGEADLISFYGMSQTAAKEVMNTELNIEGITDSNGRIVFTMANSVNYDITISYNEDAYNYNIAPSSTDNYYMFKFDSTTTSDNIWDDLYANGNTFVKLSAPNESYLTFTWSYQDMSSYTTNISYYLLNADNNTIIYQTYKQNPIAGGIYTLNYTIPNVRGQNFKYWVNYTRSV